jgi:hypothetical protein
MSVLDVWIGRLDDPKFHWDGGDWNGNLPRRVSPFLPTHAPWYLLVRKIRNGELDGKQVDYGGFVARVTKQQIRDFVRECYADLFQRFENRAQTGNPYSESEIMDAIQIGILRAFDEWLSCFSDDELHALVAAEV